jgi:hypothetical protein
MMVKPDDARGPGRPGSVTAPIAALALIVGAVLLSAPVIGVPAPGSGATVTSHPLADVGWNGNAPTAPTG